MDDKEIKKLQEKVYSLSFSGFPLDAFFNDIRDNQNPKFNKDLAYEDLKKIADEVYELRKIKKVIEFLKPHTHLASGLCEIKLADREISELHPKYHNNKEIYEPKYYEFYKLFTEVLNDNK